MNISLTPKLEAFIRQRIASGLYNNASEVVREALRLLIDQTGEEPAAVMDKAQLLKRLAEQERPLRKMGVCGLSLFGSVVRGETHPGSDVDVLIETAPGSHFSLVDLVSVKQFLEEKLGHPVDVITRDGLAPALKKPVLAEAETVF